MSISSFSSSSMACISPPLLTHRPLMPSPGLNFGPANQLTFRKAISISKQARNLSRVRCEGEKAEDHNVVSVSDTTHHEVHCLIIYFPYIYEYIFDFTV